MLWKCEQCSEEHGLLQPGAVDVFLDFISYSGGPLPEELLPQVSCPVSILWGELDPWEPIEKGRAYGDFFCVEEFVALPGAPPFVSWQIITKSKVQVM